MLIRATSSSLSRGAGLRTALLCAVALGLAACGGHAPKGQVLATVNGQEITGQDLAAEARARGGGGPPAALLQNVVGRVLLAQAAHRQKLDAYPGFPSDMARLREDFLARRLLQTVVKPAAAPTGAQIAQTMAAHPFQFGRRMHIDLAQLKFSGDDAQRSIQGLDSLDAIASRLTNLGVTFEKADRAVDTAQLNDALASRLVEAPIGSLFTVRQGDAINEIVIRSRQPVEVAPAQEQALAAQLTRQEATEAQIQAEAVRLEHQARIAYQPGYAPPKPSAPAKPAS